jgi:hypothetical protein
MPQVYDIMLTGLRLLSSKKIISTSILTLPAEADDKQVVKEANMFLLRAVSSGI